MIYLNYAATSFQKPQPVIDAVTDYLQHNNEMTAQRSYLGFEEQGMIFQAREAVAGFFGSQDSSNVIFTQNITLSLNMVLHGLLKAGDHVITTSVEHNAVDRPLYFLKQVGVEVTHLTCRSDGFLDVDLLEAAIRPNTKCLVMTHASNVLGMILPVKECFAIAQSHGLLTVLDSAQTAGFLPIDIKEMQVDVLAFTGHKGLLALAGIGGFVLSEKAVQVMRPWLAGGTGTQSELAGQPDIMPDKFEAGTPNSVGIFSLKESIQWLEKKGLKTIYQKEQQLTQLFLAGLADLPVNVLGTTDLDQRVPVVSIVADSITCDELAQNLFDDYQIVTRNGLHCAPNAHKTAGSFATGALRFSFGYATTEAEVKTCLEALRKELLQ